MSRLYLRLPPKATADAAPRGASLTCAFALVERSDAVEREGVAAMSQLAAALAKVDRVVLLVAASDVTLLRVAVPPLSGARLRAALPNLVEDRLIGDPADCVIVAGPPAQGMRTVAVVQRAWLEAVVRALRALGAKSIAAVPAQLCLPYQPGAVSAAAVEAAGGVDLALRLTPDEGVGLLITPDSADSTPAEVVQSLMAMVPELPVRLFVADASLVAYREAIDASPALERRVTVAPDAWANWAQGADAAGLDLASGLGISAGGASDWRPWRVPLALAAAVAAVNIVALNVDWWNMKREAEALRGGMVRAYQSAYPKESVILDPAAQLQQKIATAQRGAGKLAADDFLALVADLGDAWSSARPGTAATSAVSGLEYRDRNLLVRLKPGGESALEQLRPALGALGLSLSQPTTGVWQIRPAR